MALDPHALAVLLGLLQGVIEWLPVSSEGVVAVALTAVGTGPAAAVRYALFLHLGTAVAAAGYYRRRIAAHIRAIHRAPTHPDAELRFLAAATLVSGAVGVGAYVLVMDLVSALAGGLFVAAIGGLLVLTGLVQRAGMAAVASPDKTPDLIDALLVGVGQGLAVLPGVSRSGTTVSLLLLRGHEGEAALDLSFLLSIPAATGAAVIAFAEGGATVSTSALLALVIAGAVGIATLDGLVRLARRIAFWGICLGLGALAVAGGLLAIWF